MRRFIRHYQLFCLLVAVLLLPGWTDLAENVEHLFSGGRLPHSEARVDELAEEHGCSSVQHRCQCHTSTPGVVQGEEPVEERAGRPVFGNRSAFIARRPASRISSPPKRPPRVGLRSSPLRV